MKFSKLLVLMSAFVLSGCVANVQPWEKETLSKKTMQESAGNSLVKKYEEHIYFSKEAARGGSGVSGGGCGCN